MQVGSRTSDEVEVLDGIYEGDEIVIQGAKQLRAQRLLAASGETTEEEHHPASQAQDVSTLLLGILIGIVMMVIVGAGWLFLQKRPLKGKR